MYECGEISNAVNFVRRKEKLGETGQVKPAIGSIFQTAVVEVECVNIDVSFHGSVEKS